MCVCVCVCVCVFTFADMYALGKLEQLKPCCMSCSGLKVLCISLPSWKVRGNKALVATQTRSYLCLGPLRCKIIEELVYPTSGETGIGF